MGLFKDVKTGTLATEAKRAVEEGRTVFAPRLNSPMTSSGFSGSISGWAEMIEAIEAEGWVLAHWAVSDDEKHRPGAYPLFRRR
jgi:hypothetical protein